MRSQAARCRRLAHATSDDGVSTTLKGMADEYLARASELDAAAKAGKPTR